MAKRRCLFVVCMYVCMCVCNREGKFEDGLDHKEMFVNTSQRSNFSLETNVLTNGPTTVFFCFIHRKQLLFILF